MPQQKFSWIRAWNLEDNSKNCVSKLWSTIGLLFVIILKLMAWLKECTYGEKRFMKMWVRKRAYRWLGHVIAMVGHGKLIQQASVCSWSCHFMCEEGFIFWGLVVGRLGWSSMQKPCAKLCTMSPSTCGWPSGSIISHSSNMVMMHAMWRIMTLLICDHCFRRWYMYCFTPPFVKVPIRNQVCPWCTE